MKRILRNFKVSVKLTLISCAFLLPILVLLYFLTAEQNIRIDFAQKELYGNEYLRPLKEILELAPVAKHISHNTSKGYSSSLGKHAKLIENIDTRMNMLKETNSSLNTYLSTDEKFNEFVAKWEDLKHNFTIEEKYTDFISDIRGLISHAGDKSNLILDPDLDSYYIMDATLLKLPENMDLIYQILTYGKDIAEKKSLTPDEKTELIVKIGLLSSNTQALNNGVNVAFENNPAQNLKASLSKNLQKTVYETNNFLNLINEKILNADEITISPFYYEEIANNALLANFNFWDSAIGDLDNLLTARIEGFNKNKYITLGSVAVVIFLTILFVIMIIKNITSSIQELAESAKKFSNGEQNVKSKVNTKDELGTLSGIFNEMIVKINESIQSVKDEKANVEKKIEIAIEESEKQNKYLAHSVDIMLKGIEKFAQGDLTVQLQINKQDEIGKLYNGFNSAVLSIKELVQTLTETINATTEASKNITTNTSNMAVGFEEQGNQTSEVASAISEMTMTILDTSKNANLAAKAANKAGSIAKDGDKIVEKTIEGMNRIALVVTNAAETVENLGSSSDQIGEIIQVIDDIADQTNLLALNAAIEAARAGEQGRGFAVVADEVRKLAERTTKATKEIAGMIKLIQKETHSAVESISTGKYEVEQGKLFAAKAGEALKDIIQASDEVLNVINNVAAVSEEQSASAEEINNNITGISRVVNDSSQHVQEIVKASEELNNLAVNLNGLISKFKITNLEIAAA
jgi:methyl-accepting chemotaxis protein